MAPDIDSLVRTVVEAVDPNEVIQLLRELVSTPSASGNEAEISSKILRYCQDADLDASADSHGNVWAWLHGHQPGRTLLFNSHMDSVPLSGEWTVDPYGAEIRDGRLYGLGSADAKAPLAGMMVALKALRRSNVQLSGDLLLTAVISEEISRVDAKGTVMTIRDGLKAGMAVVGEPSGLNVCLGCEGMLSLDVRTQGVPWHASDPGKGINAISMMARLIPEIDRLEPASHPLLGQGAINVGTIKGGTMPNTVAAECEIRVGRFVVPGETMSTFLDELSDIIARLQREDPRFKATIHPIYDSNAQIIDSGHQVVQALKHAYRLVLHKEPVETGSRGHSDADFLQNMGGIPCVTFGPSGQGSHKEDESVDVASVIEASRIYAATAATLLAE